MTLGDEQRLDVFLHKCLRRILRIFWPMMVSNEELQRRAQTELISKQVRRRRWKWIGHVLRMNQDRTPSVALTWAPEGKRKRGRPKETWRRTVEKERNKLGFGSWAETRKVATDRDEWRLLISSPILYGERRN